MGFGDCAAMHSGREVPSIESNVPHYTAQVLSAETAAYAKLALLSTRITLTQSPFAHHAPHYTAQVPRAETAAYATLARLSTRIA